MSPQNWIDLVVAVVALLTGGAAHWRLTSHGTLPGIVAHPPAQPAATPPPPGPPRSM